MTGLEKRLARIAEREERKRQREKAKAERRIARAKARAATALSPNKTVGRTVRHGPAVIGGSVPFLSAFQTMQRRSSSSAFGSQAPRTEILGSSGGCFGLNQSERQFSHRRPDVTAEQRETLRAYKDGCASGSSLGDRIQCRGGSSL